MDTARNFWQASGSFPATLRRPVEGKMVWGVAAGLARYFQVDVNAVRMVLVALTLLGGLGVPLYVTGWLLIPQEGSERSVADELIGSGRLS